MKNKPLREKRGAHYHYLCTINGVLGYYPLIKIAASEECVVSKQVLSARLTNMFKNKYTKCTTIQQCMTKIHTVGRKSAYGGLGDFDQLNALWPRH